MNNALPRPLCRRVTAIVIGGGQAGLASSHELSLRGIDHVVLERGEVANSWATERWDSLRLLTPNWQTGLHQYPYCGDEPDGFMSVKEVSNFIRGYADFCAAPVHPHTRVSKVEAAAGGYHVQTDEGNWRCRSVIIASGPYNIPKVPALAAALPRDIEQLTTHQYRNAGQLSDGGVLVVGAAATGLQIAQEIQLSGRQVTLAVGEHLRMPRMYRGRDIQYWMHAAGTLDEAYNTVDDLRRVRGLPSPQLIGHPARIDLDLNALTDQGVNLVGRLAGVQGDVAQFSGSLANVIKLADLKQHRLLNSIDDWIVRCGDNGSAGTAPRPIPTRVESSPRLSMNLCSGEIKTVIWATGFRPDYSWLQVPVLDRKGLLQHDGGITPAPGLYAMGLPFMRKRKSSFIFGAADDAQDIAAHLTQFLSEKRCGIPIAAA